MPQVHWFEREGGPAGKSEQLIHHQAPADRRGDDVAQARFVGSA